MTPDPLGNDLVDLAPLLPGGLKSLILVCLCCLDGLDAGCFNFDGGMGLEVFAILTLGGDCDGNSSSSSSTSSFSS